MMMILDTNVVSAVMQRKAEVAVTRWLDRHVADSLYITAITVHELHYGVEGLKDGRRRASLGREIEAMITFFEDRILPLDARAAQSSGRIQGERKRVGRPVDLSDCLIAGVTMAYGATLVTRNTRHFSDLPIKIIDPWTAPL